MTQGEYVNYLETTLSEIKKVTEEYVKEHNLGPYGNMLSISVDMMDNYQAVTLLKPDEIRTKSDLYVLDYFRCADSHISFNKTDEGDNT